MQAYLAGFRDAPAGSIAQSAQFSGDVHFKEELSTKKWQQVASYATFRA